MKTYLAFRSIGMNQAEAVYCACMFLKEKTGGKMTPEENDR